MVKLLFKIDRDYTTSADNSNGSFKKAKRPIDDILQEKFDANDFARRIAGKHHLTPNALGNKLQYGHKSLTDLNSMKHTVLQGALDEHLKGITKILPRSKIINMLPRKGNQVFNFEGFFP